MKETQKWLAAMLASVSIIASLTAPAWAADEQPAATTEQPASTTEQPTASTEQPTASTEQSEATTEQPASTAEQPAATTEQPKATETPATDGSSRDLIDYFAGDSLNHWASADLADFIQADILAGYKQQDGTTLIKPQGNVTRAEFVAILLRAANVPTATGTSEFTDVDAKDWYYGPVVTASSMNLIYGKKEGLFEPNAKITRAEISAILNRFFQSTIDFGGAAKTFADVGGHWAQADIENISRAGVVAGYGDAFKPNNNATRAEAISMIRRALRKETKDATKEQDVLTAMKDFIDTDNSLNEAKKFDDAAAFYPTKATGFYLANSLASEDYLKQLDQEIQSAGGTIAFHVSGDAAYSVKSLSDRYASVAVTGQTIEVSVTQDGQTQTDSVSTDETYLLRKVDGVWKVYGAESAFQDFVNAVESNS
ncbi:S-layer homology domain-containing protein [Cohnella caldifontis]|uniref:S-layer homology domain-containing protein n=1 Tax=Cohnella caldifontis TaxID=3027471 RepID=UPI0023ECB8D4|nr:S-layer homology domain-containing protein [Cohnella sp. YIM B05605]